MSQESGQDLNNNAEAVKADKVEESAYHKISRLWREKKAKSNPRFREIMAQHEAATGISPYANRNFQSDLNLTKLILKPEGVNEKTSFTSQEKKLIQLIEQFLSTVPLVHRTSLLHVPLIMLEGKLLSSLEIEKRTSIVKTQKEINQENGLADVVYFNFGEHNANIPEELLSSSIAIKCDLKITGDKAHEFFGTLTDLSKYRWSWIDPPIIFNEKMRVVDYKETFDVKLDRYIGIKTVKIIDLQAKQVEKVYRLKHNEETFVGNTIYKAVTYEFITQLRLIGPSFYQDVLDFIEDETIDELDKRQELEKIFFCLINMEIRKPISLALNGNVFSYCLPKSSSTQPELQERFDKICKRIVELSSSGDINVQEVFKWLKTQICYWTDHYRKKLGVSYSAKMEHEVIGRLFGVVQNEMNNSVLLGISRKILEVFFELFECLNIISSALSKDRESVKKVLVDNFKEHLEDHDYDSDETQAFIKKETEGLLNQGINPNLFLEEGTHFTDKVTPLLLAIEKENHFAVKIFIEAGAQLNLNLNNVSGPLYKVSRKLKDSGYYEDIFNLLLEGFTVSQRFKIRKIASPYGREHKRKGPLELLIEHSEWEWDEIKEFKEKYQLTFENSFYELLELYKEKVLHAKELIHLLDVEVLIPASLTSRELESVEPEVLSFLRERGVKLETDHAEKLLIDKITFQITVEEIEEFIRQGYRLTADALHKALINFCSIEVIEFLLNNKTVDVNYIQGASCWQELLKCGDFSFEILSELLLKRITKCSAQDVVWIISADYLTLSEKNELIQIALTKGVNLNEVSRACFTPLTIALMRFSHFKNPEEKIIITTLLKNGASPYVRDGYGNLPLYLEKHYALNSIEQDISPTLDYEGLAAMIILQDILQIDHLLKQCSLGLENLIEAIGLALKVVHKRGELIYNNFQTINKRQPNAKHISSHAYQFLLGGTGHSQRNSPISYHTLLEIKQPVTESSDKLLISNGREIVDRLLIKLDEEVENEFNLQEIIFKENELRLKNTFIFKEISFFRNIEYISVDQFEKFLMILAKIPDFFNRVKLLSTEGKLKKSKELYPVFKKIIIEKIVLLFQQIKDFVDTASFGSNIVKILFIHIVKLNFEIIGNQSLFLMDRFYLTILNILRQLPACEKVFDRKEDAVKCHQLISSISSIYDIEFDNDRFLLQGNLLDRLNQYSKYEIPVIEFPKCSNDDPVIQNFYCSYKAMRNDYIKPDVYSYPGRIIFTQISDPIEHQILLDLNKCLHLLSESQDCGVFLNFNRLVFWWKVSGFNNANGVHLAQIPEIIWSLQGGKDKSFFDRRAGGIDKISSLFQKDEIPYIDLFEIILNGLPRKYISNKFERNYEDHPAYNNLTEVINNLVNLLITKKILASAYHAKFYYQNSSSVDLASFEEKIKQLCNPDILPDYNISTSINYIANELEIKINSTHYNHALLDEVVAILEESLSITAIQKDYGQQKAIFNIKVSELLERVNENTINYVGMIVLDKAGNRLLLPRKNPGRRYFEGFCGPGGWNGGLNRKKDAVIGAMLELASETGLIPVEGGLERWEIIHVSPEKIGLVLVPYGSYQLTPEAKKYTEKKRIACMPDKTEYLESKVSFYSTAAMVQQKLLMRNIDSDNVYLTVSAEKLSKLLNNIIVKEMQKYDQSATSLHEFVTIQINTDYKLTSSTSKKSQKRILASTYGDMTIKFKNLDMVIIKNIIEQLEIIYQEAIRAAGEEEADNITSMAFFNTKSTRVIIAEDSITFKNVNPHYFIDAMPAFENALSASLMVEAQMVERLAEFF